MYNSNDKYLYEILDDYKDATTDKEKDEIISSFMKLIWGSKNKRKIYKKDLRFSVPTSQLDNKIGQIFNMYSEVSYMSYKSMSKETDFISLIRQKINNIYTNLCDGDVCLKKEYMDLIKQPKQLYYRWKNGEVYDADTLLLQLEGMVVKSVSVKEKFAKQKMNIEWNTYKTLITPYFKRMFNNYIPLEKFEDKNLLTLDIDTWNEDNFAVAYLCKGLDGYMRMYIKQYFGVRQHKNYSYCLSCGKLFEKHNNKHKYCTICSKEKIQEYDRQRKSVNRNIDKS